MVLPKGPVAASFADQGCPYWHLLCPDPYYDCCCDRGVACTNNEYECMLFCGWV